VGDFNGDGMDDIAALDSSKGLWKVNISCQTTFSEQNWGTWKERATQDVAVSNFNKQAVAALLKKESRESFFSPGTLYVAWIRYFVPLIQAVGKHSPCLIFINPPRGDRFARLSKRIETIFIQKLRQCPAW